jgi:hypothetical protein
MLPSWSEKVNLLAKWLKVPVRGKSSIRIISLQIFRKGGQNFLSTFCFCFCVCWFYYQVEPPKDGRSRLISGTSQNAQGCRSRTMAGWCGSSNSYPSWSLWMRSCDILLHSPSSQTFPKSQGWASLMWTTLTECVGGWFSQRKPMLLPGKGEVGTGQMDHQVPSERLFIDLFHFSGHR